jgi:hypothetical protein
MMNLKTHRANPPRPRISLAGARRPKPDTHDVDFERRATLSTELESVSEEIWRTKNPPLLCDTIEYYRLKSALRDAQNAFQAILRSPKEVY